MRSDGGDELDDILDEALRSYTLEPRIGIEARVMRRVRAEGTRARVDWLRFLFAVPVFAVAIWLFWVRANVPPPPALASFSPPLALFSPPGALAPVTGNGSVQRKVRARGRTARHPDLFPTPSPLSAEEQALVGFASGNPEESRAVAAKQNEGEPAPLEIPELQIPPLETSGGF